MHEYDEQILEKKWPIHKRLLAQVLWLSFISASVGFVVIFGLIDPAVMDQAFSLPWQLSTELAYGLGFLFLYCVCLLSSGLTAFMFYTRQK